MSYLHKDYLQDLSVFCQGKEIPQYGPFWMLCGMTMGKLFEPENRTNFNSPANFICYLYGLNLIDQGVHYYYPSLLADWRLSSLPFLDSRGCNQGHGGWAGKPNSILHFAKDPSYISRAQPIDIPNELLKSYIKYFLFSYLSSIFDKRTLNPEELLARLRSDPDCEEVRVFSNEK